MESRTKLGIITRHSLVQTSNLGASVLKFASNQALIDELSIIALYFWLLLPPDCEVESSLGAV